MTAVDTDLNLTNSVDPEVRQRWYSIGCYLSYAPVLAAAETWVGEMGRNKYIQAIYTAMNQSPDQPTAYQTALGWYNNNASFYSPTTNELVMNILGL